jgi:5-aminolevulinate synthase
MNSDCEREKIRSNTAKVKLALTNAGIKFIKNDSHIIAVIIGDPELSEKISKKLLNEYNIYVQHINFPTVPRGAERLRITPTSGHNDKMIKHLIDSLKTIFNELSLVQNDQIL